MKKKVNKVLSLILAFVILLGTLPVNAMAEETEPQEHSIKIVYSKNVSESEKDVRAVEHYSSDTELTKAKAGDRVVVRNGAGLKCIVEGKLVSDGQFIMPDHDAVIYVDNNYYSNTNLIPVEELKEKPDSYATVTLNSGEHGNFGYRDYRDKNSVIKEKKFYAPKYRKVSIYGWISDIEKGYVFKGGNYSPVWDNPSQDIILDKDTTFIAQYEKKDLTFTFTNRDKIKFTKILPAQSFDRELQDTANKARTELKDGERFICWISNDPYKNYYDAFDQLFDQSPNTYRVLKRDANYKEIVSTDRILKIYEDKNELNYRYFTLVKDGGKAQKPPYGNAKYYEITKLGSFNEATYQSTQHQYDTTKEFDFENTPIKKDTNLIRVYDDNSSKDNNVTKLMVVSDPKMVYDSDKNEKKIDLSGMIVGIINPAGSRKLIPYSEFTANNIETDVKDGKSINGLNEKYIKVTMGDNFTFSNEPFDIKDDNFDKENITNIEIAQQPQLEYKYDGEKNTELNLDDLKVNLKDKNGVIRKDIPYTEFNDYGLKVKLDGEEVSNGRKMIEADNAKTLKVAFNETVSAETEALKVTTSIFNKDSVDYLDISHEPKLKYIVGDTLDLSELVVKLVDTNGNEEIYKYEDPDFKTLFDITLEDDKDLSKPLTAEDNNKFLNIALKQDDNKSAGKNISVVEFDINKVTSIEVSNQPKLDYVSGDTLDLSELVVTLTGENGATKEVKFAEFKDNKLKTSRDNGDLITDQTGPITITLEGTTLTAKTGDLQVTVIELATKDDKTKAKDAIEKLGNLSPEEKKEFQDKVDAEKAKAKIADIVEAAKAKDSENKKIKDAKELQEAKDAAKKEIESLQNLSNEEKAPFTKQVEDAKTKDDVTKALDGAKDADDLKAYKNKAKEEIGNLPNLNNPEKDKFKGDVDKATNKAGVDKVTKEAKATDELNSDKKTAKEEVNNLENIDEEAKKAANKNIDNAKSKEEVNKALEEAKKKDAEAKAIKELEVAKKEEAAAKEKEKAAEEAKVTADKAKAEADVKAAEAEKAKEEADQKAKEAEEAAKAAKEAAAAETDSAKKEEAKQKAEEAEKAAKAAKAEADQKATEANEAKAKAEDANAKVTEAENNLKEAKEEVKQAEEKVEAKQKEVDKYKEKPGTIPVDPTPSPSQPNTNYNPFWSIYFGSGTQNASTSINNIDKIKLQTKLVIGSKEMIKTVDGVEQKVMMDIAPFIDSNRTMLPIRFVAEALGFKVEWDDPSRTVILTDKDNVVRIPVDTNKIIVNGNEYESDVKPVLRNNRTTLPIANVARALGLVDGKDIIWDAKSKEVVIKREIEK